MAIPSTRPSYRATASYTHPTQRELQPLAVQQALATTVFLKTQYNGAMPNVGQLLDANLFLGAQYSKAMQEVQQVLAENRRLVVSNNKLSREKDSDRKEIADLQALVLIKQLEIDLLKLQKGRSVFPS